MKPPKVSINVDFSEECIDDFLNKIGREYVEHYYGLVQVDHGDGTLDEAINLMQRLLDTLDVGVTSDLIALPGEVSALISKLRTLKAQI